MKGDTININYQGKDYLIDVKDCKPADQICVVEADIEVDFREPLDYQAIQEKTMATPQLAKKNSALHIDDEDRQLQAEIRKKVEEAEAKHTRLDGKKLTEKQKQDLVKKEMDKLKKEEEDFDPRKHRLKHGIRNYDRTVGGAAAFEGMKGGVKLT